MATIQPTRESAYALLSEFNQNESLLRHAFAVEGVMRHFAGFFNEEDIEKWGIVGLIHDLDYEMFPEEHCTKTAEIMAERNWPADYVHAVVSHGWKLCCDVKPVERMEIVLFTIDELTGLVAATARMRPSKSVMDTEASSVLKKFRQKSFAAGVNREVIEEGAQMLGMDLEQVITETIDGMRKVAGSIGL
ncbi:MAG: hydrolase [Saccharofermentanales bacterium]